ncbi:MAG: hypothetical protein ABL998_16860, partial [Planctomycetota bacterium]
MPELVDGGLAPLAAALDQGHLEACAGCARAQTELLRTLAGVLEPRMVKVGVRLAERVEITQGLAPEEEVVAAGVFLIDSESRLRASGAGGAHGGHGGAPAP